MKPSEILIWGYFFTTDKETYELIKSNTVPEQLNETSFQEAELQTSLFGVNSSQGVNIISLRELIETPSRDRSHFSSHCFLRLQKEHLLCNVQGPTWRNTTKYNEDYSSYAWLHYTIQTDITRANAIGKG